MKKFNNSITGADNNDEKRAIGSGSAILFSTFLFILFMCNISLFAQQTYTLTVIANEGGTATGSATVIAGDSANYPTIQAFHNKGSAFSHWSNTDGDVISTSNPYRVYLVSDTTLYANFTEAPGDYLVKVAGFNSAGGGYYDEGETATLTAIPDSCQKFLNWRDYDGNVISLDNPLEIIVVSDTTLYVNFEDLRHWVEIKENIGGNIDTTYYGYTCDTIINVEAFPEEGYEFLNWTDKNNNFISKDNPLIMTATKDVTLTANFVPLSSVNESLVESIRITPNPINEVATLTLTLETEGNLKIGLNDLLGNEILEIYNGFNNTGTFTKPFSIKALPSGMYFLKVLYNGNTITKKVVKE